MEVWLNTDIAYLYPNFNDAENRIYSRFLYCIVIFHQCSLGITKMALT